MPRTLNISNLTPDTAATFDSLTVNNNLTVSGVGLFADGTAAAPSIAFTNDSDTGFYSAGSNSIGVAAQGAGQWIWTTAAYYPNSDNSDTLGDATHRPSVIHTFGLTVGTGANQSFGTVTLSSGGTALLYSTKLSATTQVFTSNKAGGTSGFITIGTLSSGAVQIKSSSTSDTGVIGYLIVEAS